MRAVIQMVVLTTAGIMIIFSPTFFAVPTTIAAKAIASQTDIAAVAEPETFPIIPSSASESTWNFVGRTGDGGN